MRNIFLVLDLLDRELVQPDLFSDPLTTSSILGTGLVSEECVDLQTNMREERSQTKIRQRHSTVNARLTSSKVLFLSSGSKKNAHSAPRIMNAMKSK